MICPVRFKEMLSHSGSEGMIQEDLPVLTVQRSPFYVNFLHSLTLLLCVVILSTLFFSKQQMWLLVPLKDEEFFLEPLLNSSIGGSIFLCCLSGKASKQVLLQSRIFSFLHFRSFILTVCKQAILRLKRSTYSQAVHSAAYCICSKK